MREPPSRLSFHSIPTHAPDAALAGTPTRLVSPGDSDASTESSPESCAPEAPAECEAQPPAVQAAPVATLFRRKRGSFGEYHGA